MQKLRKTPVPRLTLTSVYNVRLTQLLRLFLHKAEVESVSICKQHEVYFELMLTMGQLISPQDRDLLLLFATMLPLQRSAPDRHLKIH